MNNDHHNINIELPILIGRLQNKLNRSVNGALSAYDLKYTQYRLLEILSINQSLHASKCARELSIESSSITAQIDKLEKFGLISRRYDRQDRRFVWIEINQKGINVSTVGRQAIKTCFDDFFKNIDIQDIEHLHHLCQTLLTHADGE